MNHLAHIFLSCDNEDLLIGNFIADFIKNREVTQYASSIQEGIFLHRQIDTYTDQHPLVRKGVKRLRPFHRKYAPVVIDVLFDHLLVKNWHRYSGQEINSFADDIYEIFQKRMEEMPPKLQERLPRMIAANWLPAYGTQDGLYNTFVRMDMRTRFPSNFAAAVEHLQADYAFFEVEFNAFFPEVIAFVEQQCKAN